MEDFKYKLPMGKKILKKRIPFNKLSQIQQKIYKRIYDPLNGPLEFAEHCCYANRNGVVQYIPYDYQREMIFNMHCYDSNISMCGRQMGKTQTSVCYILWFAMANSHKTILITSFGDDSAKKNLADVKFVYEYCPDFLKAGIVRMNESTIVFDNGSKIISKPTTGKSVRGNSPSLIYCDEFAFVGTVGNKTSNNLQEEFYAAVSPALAASKGKICITSTPISETDLFHHLWVGAINKQDDNGLDLSPNYMIEINGELYRDMHLFKTEDEGKIYLNSIGNPKGWKIVPKIPCGNNGFMSLLATWERCPGRTEEWARLERKKVGDARFNREYNCLSGKSMVCVIDDYGNELHIPIETLYSYHMSK